MCPFTFHFLFIMFGQRCYKVDFPFPKLACSSLGILVEGLVDLDGLSIECFHNEDTCKLYYTHFYDHCVEIKCELSIKSSKTLYFQTSFTHFIESH